MVYQLASILPMMVCLLWTVIGALDYRESDPARRMLTVFGLVATCLYSCHFLHFNGHDSLPTEALYFFCNLSVYPLYAVYVRRLTRENPRFWQQEWWWFLPAFCVLVLVFVLPYATVQTIDRWVFPLVSLAACLAAGYELMRFRGRVENYYSSPEGKRLNPILTLIILQIVTVALSFTVNLLGRESFVESDLLIAPAILFSLLLFGIFYVGFRTDFPAPDVRTSFIQKSNPARSEEEAIAANETQQRLLEKIAVQMKEKQLFRTKGLTISDLATAVGSNRTYVSTCINQNLGVSFSDYINGDRVHYAMKRMQSPDAPSLAEIAEEAGFADRTSFYRCFKRVSGTNPSAWMAGKRP